MPYKIYELRGDDYELYLGEVDEDVVGFGRLLLINNNYYECCRLNTENELYVRWVCCEGDLPEEEETYNEDCLVCPYCGYENKDSFELPDEDDEYVCPRCGSVLKYSRNITISYDVEVVGENEPQEIELK